VPRRRRFAGDETAAPAAAAELTPACDALCESERAAWAWLGLIILLALLLPKFF